MESDKKIGGGKGGKNLSYSDDILVHAMLSFFCFFLSVIWPSHDQLWTIIEGTALLTRC